MKTITNQRLEWLDAVKGLGIILVLIGHCENELLTDYIYMFHMPLFFIISGFCWNTEKYSMYSFEDLLKKKFNSYIIPYLKVSFVCFLVYGVLYAFYRFGISADYIRQLLKYLYGILIYSKGTSEWLPSCSPIWFLTCLFVAEIIYWFINRYKGICQAAIVIAVGLVGISLSHSVKLPWNIDNACSAVPLLYMGTLVRKYGDKLLSEKLLPLYIISTVVIFIYGVKGGDFDGNYFPNFYIMYLQTTVITVCILSAFKCSGGG